VSHSRAGNLEKGNKVKHFMSPSRAGRALALALVLALFVACDEEKPSDNGSPKKAGGTPAGDSIPRGSSNLGKYADKPCELLTEDMVRAEIPGMPAEVEHSTGTKRLRFCQYSWAGPRKASREVMGRKIEYPVNDSVSLKWIRVLDAKDPLAYFRNSYRPLTEEEKAELKARMQKRMDEKAAKGDVSRETANAGGKMAGGMIGGLRFERVEGVGTAAAWGGTMGSYGLKVLDRDTEFEISVDVYEDDAKNRDAAIRLAKKILANAK
jgi:hypothetical protein